MTAIADASSSIVSSARAHSSRTRILVVNDHLGWGNQVSGVTRLFEMWASYLPNDLYDMRVCILNRPSELASGLRQRGSPVLFLPKRKYDPSTLTGLMRLVRRNGIDVLHLQGYRSTAFGKIVARMTGIPTVIHFHDTSDNYPLIQNLSDRMLGRLGDVHLAVSKSVRTCWASRSRLAEDRVRVLYNCTSLSEFRQPSPEWVQKSRRELGIPEQANVVGTVTRLFPEKGIRYLIQAAPRVLARCPNTWFVIVGDGPQRVELEAMVNALGLRERVRFLGYVDRVSPVLAAFDVHVLSSCVEGGSPLPVLEAMFMAKPVVATDLVEIIDDGVTGLLIPPRNAELLAERIIAVLSDPALSARLGAEGHHAAARFDVRPYVTELGRIYDSLAARRVPLKYAGPGRGAWMFSRRLRGDAGVKEP